MWEKDINYVFLDGKKTNKAKLKFLIFFCENQLNCKAIAFDEIGGNCDICKFNKYAPIRVLLQAEFISAMKTVQNPTVFMRNVKRIEKWVILIIFVIWGFTETLDQNVRKNHKICFFLDENEEK